MLVTMFCCSPQVSKSWHNVITHSEGYWMQRCRVHRLVGDSLHKEREALGSYKNVASSSETGLNSSGVLKHVISILSEIWIMKLI